MNVEHLLRPRRLRADDIDEDGIERSIRKVTLEQVPRHGLVPVVYFYSVDHGLALTSPTNVERIAEAYGIETDAWIGQRVTLQRAFYRDDESDTVTPWIRVSA